MTTLIVHPAERPLVGSVPAPPDQAVGVRAMVLGALGEGSSRLGSLALSGEVASMARGLAALGVKVEALARDGRRDLVVHGVGWDGLRGPPLGHVIDCGDFPLSFALFAGILAGQRFKSRLVLKRHLAYGPPARVLAALRSRGAGIQLQPADPRLEALHAETAFEPLGEEAALAPLDHALGEADPLTKGALLFSGLYASGPTRVREPTVSPDHTERLLDGAGVPLRTVGGVVELEPGAWSRRIEPLRLEVPGDVSAAMLLVLATQLVPGSEVTIRGVGTNPTRAGVVEMARDLGAGLGVDPKGESGGEPTATFHAWPSTLRSLALGGEILTRSVSGLPLAFGYAARAPGLTRVRIESATDETPREGEALALALRSFGVACRRTKEGFEIQGHSDPLEPADLSGSGDPWLAMMAAVLALSARAPSRIRDAEGIARVYPKFVATLRALGARIDVQP